ncbi:UNVERIFIED_CONTAM: hypothetical protein HDU68_006872 [Siphonaria sp. JEL0065]|nr:hypothetical protein HDU68_006872 [Siphonaria sp. JEL0065]
MPQIQFNTLNKSLSIIPFANEKIVAFYYGNGRIRIPYNQIKAVRIRPPEAYSWSNGQRVATGTKTTRLLETPTSIVRITRWKPDLHLHSNPSNAIGLDLVGNFKYGRIYVEVPVASVQKVAERIQQEIAQASLSV